ncbi:hypothetical protein CHUAL_013273 [Chamberlinius hualienensis]
MMQLCIFKNKFKQKQKCNWKTMAIFLKVVVQLLSILVCLSKPTERTLFVTPGQNVRIKCEFDQQINLADIAWMKDGVEIIFEKYSRYKMDSSDLVIENATEYYDATTFECMIKETSEMAFPPKPKNSMPVTLEFIKPDETVEDNMTTVPTTYVINNISYDNRLFGVILYLDVIITIAVLVLFGAVIGYFICKKK